MSNLSGMDISDLIERAGSVSALAVKLGVDHSTVSGWKRDNVLPAGRIKQVHEKMGIPLEELLPMVGVATKRNRLVAKAA